MGVVACRHLQEERIKIAEAQWESKQVSRPQVAEGPTGASSDEEGPAGARANSRATLHRIWRYVDWVDWLVLILNPLFANSLGERFTIPQKRSQADVDAMSDRDILLEAVQYAPGGNISAYQNYAKLYATAFYLFS